MLRPDWVDVAIKGMPLKVTGKFAQQGSRHLTRQWIASLKYAFVY